MGASRSIACVVVSVFCAASTWAADGVDQNVASTDSAMVIPSSAVASVDGGAHQLSTEEGAPLQPWIHSRMKGDLRARVEVAFEIAAQRVQESEACTELFTELGVDAMETLDSALYWPVKSHRDVTELCRGRNLAFTFVGSPLTFICPDFKGVSDQRAAQVIIHEALHNAGLKERPQYKGFGVKSSAAIDSMVAKACKF
jgi:hypothetical protein